MVEVCRNDILVGSYLLPTSIAFIAIIKQMVHSFHVTIVYLRLIPSNFSTFSRLAVPFKLLLSKILGGESHCFLL